MVDYSPERRDFFKAAFGAIGTAASLPLESIAQSLENLNRRGPILAQSQTNKIGLDGADISNYGNAKYSLSSGTLEESLLQNSVKEKLFEHIIYGNLRGNPNKKSEIMSDGTVKYNFLNDPETKIEFFRYSRASTTTFDRIDVLEYSKNDKGQRVENLLYTAIYNRETNEMKIYGKGWEITDFKKMLESVSEKLNMELKKSTG